MQSAILSMIRLPPLRLTALTLMTGVHVVYHVVSMVKIAHVVTWAQIKNFFVFKKGI